MASIALIGPDGAGKTTLTRMLEKSGILPFRYIYMGIDLNASNIALPTSRLFQRMRARENAQCPVPPGAVQHRSFRSKARGFVRLLALLAEEWFRQFVSWFYQARGFTVLYDRHFVFDFAPEIAGTTPESLDKRLHRWFLQHLYPRPGLVIFLDAPGELLYARKGESTPEELERRRQVFLRIGTTLPRFRIVDATRPLKQVYEEIAWHAYEFAAGRQRLTDPPRSTQRTVRIAR
jgi:thymidylate kinase